MKYYSTSCLAMSILQLQKVKDLLEKVEQVFEDLDYTPVISLSLSEANVLEYIEERLYNEMVRLEKQVLNIHRNETGN